MNRNKIIFLSLGIGLLVFIIVAFVALSNQSNKRTGNSKNAGDFSIWVLQDDQGAMKSVVDSYKSSQTKYSQKNVQVISFSTYEEYFSSLLGAFVRGEAPDLFMIQNSDGKFFESQTYGIDNDTINIDEFRNKYEEVFATDLIRTSKDGDEEVEFLAGLPIGYEPPVMFYNFRELKGKNLSTWSYIDEVVREQREENQQTTLGIGDGSTVWKVGDILKQFLVQNNVTGLGTEGGGEHQSAFETYLSYGKLTNPNQYRTFHEPLLQENEDNLDLFADGKVHIVFGYPRMLEQLNKRSIPKSFLRSAPFPTNTESGDKYAISYNYLAVNKSARDLDFAFGFVAYLNDPSIQSKYLSKVSYLLPAQFSLINDRLNETVLSGYNIKYSSFYNKEAELVSFDTKYQTLYDQEIKAILDNEQGYSKDFSTMRERINCLSTKTSQGTNLDTSCEK